MIRDTDNFIWLSVTRRRDGNSTIPLPYHCIPINLDIQSTLFVSFHLNSIRCKRDLVSLLEKKQRKNNVSSWDKRDEAS